MIDINIVSTGSKGNAVYLNNKILIDCGVPFSKLETAKIVDNVRFVFLTHQHSDHINISTLYRLIANRPTVKIIYPEYLCKYLYQSFKSHRYNSNFLFSNSIIVTTTKWYRIGNLQFSCEPLQHDVPNVAWKIFFLSKQNKPYKVIYATDTNSIENISANNYDLYLIENNYAREDIVNRIKEKRATGQFVYEDRVLRTHLSEEQCNDFIFSNIGPNGKFMYMHGHEDKDISDDNISTDS